MQRIMKENGGKQAVQARAAQRKPAAGEGSLAARINNSPMMAAQRKKLDSLFGGAIQRAPDEELLQGRFEAAQRMEDEEPLQGKFETAQRMEEEEPIQGKSEAASPIQRKDEAAKPNNTGLPDNLKSGIESLSGLSMDNVRVHYNSSQPAQLNAHAYAQGTDIHVAPGQERHLPHEAWHVVQQAQGRVQPTTQMKAGISVNNDKSLEHEADVMGARASVEEGIYQVGDGSKRRSGDTGGVSLSSRQGGVIQPYLELWRDNTRSVIREWTKEALLQAGVGMGVLQQIAACLGSYASGINTKVAVEAEERIVLQHDPELGWGVVFKEAERGVDGEGNTSRSVGWLPSFEARPEEGYVDLYTGGVIDCLAVVVESRDEDGETVGISMVHFITGESCGEFGLTAAGVDQLNEISNLVRNPVVHIRRNNTSNRLIEDESMEGSGVSESDSMAVEESSSDSYEVSAEEAAEYVRSYFQEKGWPVTTEAVPPQQYRYRLHHNGGTEWV